MYLSVYVSMYPWYVCMICMVWYGMVWYGMVWYGTVRYGTVRYGMVWYGMYVRMCIYKYDIYIYTNV